MSTGAWMARAEVTQDFSGWPQGAPVTQGAGPWGTYTNNDWILGTGQIWTDYSVWHPHSATQACYLRDYDESTNSWLRSPWLSNGVGRVTWYALNRRNSYICQFQLQYSTNGTVWETVGVYTNATAGYVWAGYTNILEEWRAGYLRWRHGPDNFTDLRLGLDDLVLADPKGFKLTNLANTPGSPTIDDPVHIQCNVRINEHAGSTAVNAYYRFGTNGSFAWRPMAVVSGELWRTQTPVPAGRTGLVQYYVEATYTGMGGGTVRLPEKGYQTWTSTDTGGGTIDPRQNGPCSRATGLSLSEILYHPAPRTDGLDLEYVEVLNTEPVPADIGGYRLSGDVEYTFAAGTVVAAGARVVVAADPHAVELVFPTSGILGPWTGSLPNGGGTVRLRNAMGAILVDVAYDDAAPWPAAADGGGASLVQMKPDYGEGDVRSWAPSARVGGSPGYTLPNWGEALSKVVINEWMSHTDPPLEDSIELYNAGATAVSLAGCVLTDDVSTNRYVIALGTTIAADGYVVFTASQLGFDLSMSGDRLFLLGPSGTRVVDAISFGAQENGVSWGRTPDGAAEWTELSARTFGSANARVKLREVVINEIMYHPISGVDADEYVELLNRSAGAVDIGNWRFIDGIDYRFPAGTTIAAGGYVVVASDRTRLLSRYPALAPAKVFGNYSGKLSDRGERLVLAKPDDPALPGQDFVPVDEVSYSDGWGQWADGGGSSLELIDAHSDNRLGPNWAGSDETAKSAWTTIDYTDSIDNGVGGTDPFEMFGPEPGEYIVDDIVMTDASGVNFSDNFEAGPAGWSFRGCHVRTTVAAGEGYGGSKGLHIRASERGEFSGADGRFLNNVGKSMLRAPASGQIVRIQAKARWVCGFPYLIMGTRGYWFATPGALSVPSNLGTPGQLNSRQAANAGPAIWSVEHSPVLPAASAAVTVTCRADDPDGIQSLNLKYRIDPAFVTNTVAMQDNGVGADSLAGDGLYSAVLPGQIANTLAVFVIEGRDAAVSPANTRFPGKSAVPIGSPSECLVMWGMAAPKQAGLPTYRVLITAANQSLLTSYGDYSKELVDSTFVYEGWRAVYSAGTRQRAGAGASGYVHRLNKGERVLGANKITILSGASFFNIGYTPWVSLQLGEPAGIMRPVAFGYRTGAPALLVDYMTPSTDLCAQWFGDPDPEVFKNFDWTGDAFGIFRNAFGALKTSIYAGRSVKRGTIQPNNDYSQVFKIATTAATADNSAYVERVKAVIDVRHWAAYFALSGLVGDVDKYGYNWMHNYYVYIPRHGRSHLLLHDMDFAFGASAAVLWPANHPVPKRMFVDTPTFTRTYWSLLKDAADGPLQASRVAGFYDPWAAVFTANGLAGVAAQVTITSGGGLAFSTATTPLTLTGTAPVNAETLCVNGQPHFVSYTGLTNWQMKVALVPGPNVLTVSGYDHAGRLVSNGGTDGITVTYTGSAAVPDGKLVINEIMYNAAEPYAAFIELRNVSSDTVALGGLRMEGVDCVIEQGRTVTPGGYVVLAGSIPGYQAAYSNAEVVVGEFAGSLDNGGEWLRLWRPGTGTNEVLVDEVYYDNSAPWPTAADGTGPSLQLIDATRDNNRVGNWAVDAVKRFTPGKANSVAASLPVFPEVWINEVMPSNTTFAVDNHGDHDPWLELYNAQGSSVDLGSGYRLSVNATNLTGWAFPSGRTVAAGGYQLAWMDAEASETTPSELHAGLRLSSPTGLVVLVWNSAGRDLVLDYLSWNGTVPANSSWGRYPEGERYGEHLFQYPTPGTANNAASAPVMLRLNEWMADNARTLSDPANPVQPAYQDWFEIANAGGSAVNLTGFTLSDTLANPAKYRIPLGWTLGAGAYLRVWADEETGQNAVSNGDLHVNFKLSASGEELGLYAPDGTPLDTQSFETQLPDISEGRWPDGTGTVWQMAIPTPKASNVLFEVQQMRTNAGGTVRLQWNSRPGWLYRLWSNTDLLSGAWQPVGTGYWANATTMSTNVPATGPRYYRVGQR
jgi:hypothetical protein